MIQSRRPLTGNNVASHHRSVSMGFEEADDRLLAGWHVVGLPEPGPMCSAQRKRYLRLERERCNALAIDAKFDKEH